MTEDKSQKTEVRKQKSEAKKQLAPNPSKASGSGVTEYKAIGRRKEASARVTIKPGSGVIKINKREFKDYFPRETLRMVIMQPINTCEVAGKIDVVANVKGSGNTGQAGAIRHAIARTLLQYNGDFKDKLKKGGFLTRDPRMKERKKPGQEGARRKFQWVKR